MEHQRTMLVIPKPLLMSVLTAVAITCSFFVTASESTHPRDVWQSLSAAERKLPRDILVQQLQAQGKAVPTCWLRSSQARSKNVESELEPIMYRLVGEDIDKLQAVMGLVESR